MLTRIGAENDPHADPYSYRVATKPTRLAARSAHVIMGVRVTRVAPRASRSSPRRSRTQVALPVRSVRSVVALSDKRIASAAPGVRCGSAFALRLGGEQCAEFVDRGGGVAAEGSTQHGQPRIDDRGVVHQAAGG